jgi:hypothetical protein
MSIEFSFFACEDNYPAGARIITLRALSVNRLNIMSFSSSEICGINRMVKDWQEPPNQSMISAFFMG